MAKYLSEADMSTGEYISRDEALKIFHQCCDNCTNSYNGVMCRACADAGAMDILIDMPSADVQPVKYGRWIDVYTWTMLHEFKSSGRGEHFWCSECEQGQKQKSNYCPNCGADMRGDAE